jgi:DNA repair protein RecO (recombination protein O)
VKTSSSEAIVLKLADYRESDRLVTLFTPDHGKLNGIARGAKRSVRRFGGALELFARLQLQVRLKQGLSELVSADIMTIHPGIRGDLDRIAHAGYACELVAELAPEGMANPRLFRLLASYLSQLDKHPATVSDRRFFEINFLNIIGYRPSLEICSRCGTRLGSPPLRAAHVAAGEILCSECAPHAMHVPEETRQILCSSLRIGRFGTIRFSGSAIIEAGALLDAAIAAHLGVPLRSLAFLAHLEPDQLP